MEQFALEFIAVGGQRHFAGQPVPVEDQLAPGTRNGSLNCESAKCSLRKASMRASTGQRWSSSRRVFSRKLVSNPEARATSSFAPRRVGRRQAVDRQLQIDVPQQLGSPALPGLFVAGLGKSKGKRHV